MRLEDEIYIRPFWRSQFGKENEDHEADAPHGLCLVTGESDQPIALTHNLQRTETSVAGRPGRREIDSGRPHEVFGKTAQDVLMGDQHRVAHSQLHQALA